MAKAKEEQLKVLDEELLKAEAEENEQYLNYIIRIREPNSPKEFGRNSCPTQR